MCDAASEGDAEKVRALVAAGADIDAKGAYGYAPLHRAVANRHADAVRALGNVPNLTIHLGEFVSYRTTFPLADEDPPRTVAVIKTEEKRTDVNLATNLLVDCLDDDSDEAVIVSNDSDLTLPVEVVVGKFGKPVGMINPHPRIKLSSALRAKPLLGESGQSTGRYWRGANSR